MNLTIGIAALKEKIGHSAYSMEGSRNFSDGTCDCSGAVYYALRQSGGFDLGYIPSTETLHDYLLRLGFVLIAENTDWEQESQDVVIWGRKGESAGAGGHTGICIDNQNWLECTAWLDLGETLQNHDERWAMCERPYFYVYRYQGHPQPTPPSPQPHTPNKVQAETIYGLHLKGGDWNGQVANFNNTDSNGFAGLPNHEHDLLYLRSTHGNIRYRVHTIEDGWLGWVNQGNPTDTVNGCAGVVDHTIDGVQCYYDTPQGEVYQQARYRSQTTKRAGWLPSVEDDEDFAGMLGEPLDRLQVYIDDHNRF